jgi:tetratricopeptide (TPR) repeat protein
MGALVFSRDNQTAWQYCEQSRALFEELDDYWWTAETLLRLGDIIFALGDYAQQQAYIERALDLYKKAGNERGIAVALSLLGDSNNSQGRPEAALRLGLESLAVFRALDDPMGIGLCLRRIGHAKVHLGKLEEARQDTLQSASLFAEIGARRDESIAYIALAWVDMVEGNYARARTYAQKALDIVQHLGDQVLTALSLSILGSVILNGGAHQEALPLLREAVAISEQTVGSSDLAHEYAALGLAEWQAGLGKLARMHCFKGLRLAVQYTPWWEGLRVLSVCTLILADGENPQRAVELFSMLCSDPYFTYNAWFEDEIGKPMRTVMETLPADVVASALDRGKQLDLWETATVLLDELRILGWDEEVA